MNIRDRLNQKSNVLSPEVIASRKKLRNLFCKILGGFLCAEAFVFLFVWWLFRG